MERKDGKIEKKVINVGELLNLISRGELKVDVRGKIWTDSDIKSAISKR